MPHVLVGREHSTPIELWYEDQGSGKPVVLIHGWPLSGASWVEQRTALLAAGYRVITYDRRGFGESSRPAGGYDYDTLADDLGKILMHLDLRDAALVGFSMGTGEVARYLHAYGSKRVSCAIFIASILPFLPRTAENPGGLDVAVLDRVRDAVADRDPDLPALLADFYDVDVARGDPFGAAVIGLGWNVAAAASQKATLDCATAWRTDFRKELSSIDVPSLIVHGEADRTFPLAATAIPLQAALRRSRLVVIEGAPHGLIWTHAPQVNHELRQFLAAQGFPGSRTPPTARSSEE